MTTVEVGGSAPTTSTAAGSRPISSCASRSAHSTSALARVGAAAGERDLARVAAQVGAALGEDQARVVGPAEQRHQDRRALAAVGVEATRPRRVEEEPGELAAARPEGAQMITWTVPPSTLQAAPSDVGGPLGAEEGDHRGDLVHLGEPADRPPAPAAARRALAIVVAVRLDRLVEQATRVPSTSRT